MPIDKAALREAADLARAKAIARAPTGIAGMLAGIHRGELGAFLTIESTVLPPVPLPASRAIGAVVVAPAGDGTWRPWAVLAWSWPDGAVVRRERAAAELGRPAVAMTLDAPALRALCAAAEATMSGGDVSPLLPLYRRLLGPEGIHLLAAAFPESAPIWKGG